MQKLSNVQLYGTCSRNLEGFNNLEKQNRTIALRQNMVSLVYLYYVSNSLNTYLIKTICLSIFNLRTL